MEWSPWHGEWSFCSFLWVPQGLTDSFLALPQYTWGFPGGSVVKNPPASAEDSSSTPGSGKIPWRRKWQPTPVFLPGKSHGQRSLVGYSPWHRKESDMTKRLNSFGHRLSAAHLWTIWVSMDPWLRTSPLQLEKDPFGKPNADQRVALMSMDSGHMPQINQIHIWLWLSLWTVLGKAATRVFLRDFFLSQSI